MAETTIEVLETAEPRTNNNTKLFLLIGAAFIFLLCACMCCGIFLIGSGLFRVGQEREPVTQTLNEFMILMEAGNLDDAYELFSRRAQGNILFSELEELGGDANIVLFDGYQSLEIFGINVSQSVNTNQSLPQGTVAQINGVVYYSRDFQGTFTATLEKEDEVWRLFAINITVPPEKFQDYYENNPQEDNS